MNDFKKYETAIRDLIKTGGKRCSDIVSAIAADRDTVEDGIYDLYRRGLVKIKPDSTLIWDGCPECGHANAIHGQWPDDGWMYCSESYCNCGNNIGR